MIIVNLLPHHMRPIKRTPLPYIASSVVLALVLVIAGLTIVAVQRKIATENNKLTKIDSELRDLGDVVEQWNDLIKRKRVLADKILVITEILDGRIIWSQELHKLAALTPENIWYKRIQESRKSIQVKKTVIDPKTKETKVESVMEQKPVLKVEGYAIHDKNGEASITPLLRNTSASTDEYDFTERFTFLEPKINPTTFANIPVRGFELDYLIKQGE